MQRVWTNRIRSDAKRLWNDEAAIRDIHKKAVNFGISHLKMTEADAGQAALSSISDVWEECKFGRLSVQTEDDFWSSVSKKMTKYRPGEIYGKFISLDETIPTKDGNFDRHSSGLNGYHHATQIDTVYLGEVISGINNLPEKYKKIMTLLCEGQNVLDIAETLNLPVHTAFHQVGDARNFLRRIDW